MRSPLYILALAACLPLFGGAAPAVADDDTPAELIKAIDQSLQDAGSHYRSQSREEATAALDQAKAKFATLKKSAVPAELQSKVERIGQRIAAAER